MISTTPNLKRGPQVDGDPVNKINQWSICEWNGKFYSIQIWGS